MTTVQPRHWSYAPGAPHQMVPNISPADPAYSSLPPSPVRPPSSQTVRHVPHSPSFRQLPVTVPSYAFKQTPRARSPVPVPVPVQSSPKQASPTMSSRPVFPSHSSSPASGSPDLSQRYRRGHRRSEVSIGSAPRSVSAPNTIPQPLTRSWSSQSLMATPAEPSYTANSPSMKPISYHQSFSQQLAPSLQQQQHQSLLQQGFSHSPEQYYHIHRQSPAAVYGRTQSPARQSSRSSSSSSLSSMSLEPPSRYNVQLQMHSRKASVASVVSGDSRHARHSSIDSASTSSSNSRGTPQHEYSERRSRLSMASVVPMDRSGAEVLLASNASKTTPAPVHAPQRLPIAVQQEKKVSRFKKALSFIAPASTYSASTPVNVTEIEEEVIEYNFGNNSIYESRKSKEDDNMSIRSTASTVSKALKRISMFGGSKGGCAKSDSNSVMKIDHASSVLESNDIAVQSAESDKEGEKKFAPLKKVDFVPKSILKNAGTGRIEVASEEPLPGLTRESSPVSQSSLSSSSLSGVAQPQAASHRATLSQHSSSSVSFSPEIKIYTTWNSGEYDRKIPDTTSFSTYPLWMIAQIKEEINTYKMMEMEIHELSRSNTCFY
ncbi:uncharacterized protein V1513DRAFT_430360 [Lipomyces chichibuensis]|uniref:uncharacterized protein n=1 Tax=Lipomyces chichibuensis TaxID=1546026 RepID=UPI003342E97E